MQAEPEEADLPAVQMPARTCQQVMQYALYIQIDVAAGFVLIKYSCNCIHFSSCE
jgi:hypothetical protein